MGIQKRSFWHLRNSEAPVAVLGQWLFVDHALVIALTLPVVLAALLVLEGTGVLHSDFLRLFRDYIAVLFR